MRIHFLLLRTPKRPRQFSDLLLVAMLALSVAVFASVVGCAGGGSGYNPPPPPNPAPSLSANAPLSPSSATAGGSAFTLTVTGSSFLFSSTVQWNGSQRATTFVSGSSLQAAITAADIATAGTAMVTVTTPSPGGGTSAAATFTINNPVPTVASLNPNSAIASTSGFTLTVTGTNFLSSSTVQWNGSSRTTTFVSSTQLQAAISAADIATAGTATVTVVNAAPGGGTSGGTTFTINNPIPAATSLNPTSAFAGSAAFTLTVTGTGFVASSAVQWNGSARTTTFVSNTSLQAGITAADIASVGTAMVTVSNPAPGGGTSGPLTFSIKVPPPVITLLNPSSTIMGGAAFTLTVTGTNFVSASAVQWNGSARTSTFVSTTELQAAITAADIATIGTAKVTVVNPSANGGTSMASTFFVGSSGGANFAVISVNQTAQDIVFDPKNQVFYLSVTGTDLNHPNTISVLDPATCTISSSIPAGSNPNVLAISDDSQFLYAGIDGSASVQRFTLPGLAKDIGYSLGGASNFALDLQVAPGAPHTAAVTIGDAAVDPAAEGGITIFDDAAARPMKVPGFGGTGNLFDSLQWGTDATTLFAANNEDTGFDFYTLSVNSSGVALTKDYPNTFSSFSGRIHFDSGTKLIYADGGLVLDPSPGLPVGNFNTQRLTVPDSTLNTAFIIPNSISSSVVIESFDLTHFTPISSITIPNVSANPTRFIRWGQNGLAFITGGFSGTPQIFLVAGNFVSPAPTFIETPPPTPTPPLTPATNAPAISQLNPSSAVAGGTGFTMNVSGTNFVASSTVQWNGSPRSTAFVSSTQLHAAITTADLTTSGTISITVSNPSANGGVSGASTFFIGATGGTSSTGTGFAVAVVNQVSKDLVFDPAHREIFLSVPNTVANGNTISVLDLATAKIVGDQFAGSSPDVLAISDDNQFLYAGIHGSASVQRFTLPALAQDINYSLGTVAGGPFALDLQVAPGLAHTTAVTLAVSSSSPIAQGGITIFDDGTARPTKAPGFGPTPNLYDSIQWGSDTTALFAANDEDDAFDFYTLSVNASGVSLSQDFRGDFSSFSNRIHFDSGTKLVYADDGHVVSPSTGLVVGNFNASGLMVPDSSLNTAFFIVFGSPNVTIESFNLTTFALVSSVTIPNVTGNPLRLIRWGQNGLAFNTDGGQLVLVGGSFVH